MEIDKKEKRKHSSGAKRYSYYCNIIPDSFIKVPLHWHGELEISYVLSGRGEFVIGNKKHLSKKGDIIIVPPDTLHAVKFYNNIRHRYDTIVFDKSMLGINDNDRGATEFLIPIIESFAPIIITDEHVYYNEIAILVENIISSARGNTPKLDLLLKGELMRLFWLLDESGDIFINKNPNKNDTVRKAITYINEKFKEDITVDDLANMVNLSKSYFMNLFKKMTGMSVVEYLNRVRIKNACQLLTEGGQTVTEIAFSCGFRNISNFNKQFKKITTQTPLSYKTENK